MSMGMPQVLEDWARVKIRDSGDVSDGPLLAQLVERLSMERTASFAEVAQHAARHGRRSLAAQLLEHERSASLAVPLLLELDRYPVAIDKVRVLVPPSPSPGRRDLQRSLQRPLSAIVTGDRVWGRGPCLPLHLPHPTRGGIREQQGVRQAAPREPQGDLQPAAVPITLHQLLPEGKGEGICPPSGLPLTSARTASRFLGPSAPLPGIPLRLQLDGLTTPPVSPAAAERPLAPCVRASGQRRAVRLRAPRGGRWGRAAAQGPRGAGVDREGCQVPTCPRARDRSLGKVRSLAAGPPRVARPCREHMAASHGKQMQRERKSISPCTRHVLDWSRLHQRQLQLDRDLGTKSLVGLPVAETLRLLLRGGHAKQAQDLRKEFGVSERLYQTVQVRRQDCTAGPSATATDGPLPPPGGRPCRVAAVGQASGPPSLVQGALRCRSCLCRLQWAGRGGGGIPAGSGGAAIRGEPGTTGQALQGTPARG